MKGSLNLQDVFLNKVRKENKEVTIFLINGYQIKGFIKGFDNYVIIIENSEKQQMVYKHAVSTIIPSKQIKLVNKTSDEE
ncbi:MAG TPA: RNA chaperone Hfq [Tissierellia bacterium]|nr:RNA chaperone Hfq [Tissierellia bacterium]